MLQTAEHLMTGCGLNIVYAYTQSDEISLLFAPEENRLRRLRKLLSVLSGEASARFSLLLGCGGGLRLPDLATALGGVVVDYFRWQPRTPTATP